MLSDLLFKLKYKGSIIIHELKQLLLGEKEFITFDEEDILFLFKDMKQVTCNILPFKSKRSQIEMYNAYILKTTEGFVSFREYKNKLGSQFFELLKRKQVRLINEIENFTNKDSKSYAYLIALYTNVSKAMTKLEANRNIWLGKEVRCWICGNKVKLEHSDLDIDLDGYEADIRCPNCGFRNKVVKGRESIEETIKDVYMLHKLLLSAKRYMQSWRKERLVV